MPTSAQLPPIPIDERGMIIVDVPCSQCSYNLRGLPADSKCPECATAIEFSIRGNLLRFCEPNWLDRLALGAGLILCALIIDALTARPIFFYPSPNQRAVILASSVLALIGTWMLTIANPAGHELPGVVVARHIARAGTGLTVARAVWFYFAESDPGNPPALVSIGMGMAALAQSAGEAARLYYLRELASRVPDEKSAAAARFLSYGYSACIGMVNILIVIFEASMPFLLRQPRWPAREILLFRVSILIAWVAVLGLTLVYVIILIRLIRSLRVQKKMGKALKLAASTAAKPGAHAPALMDVHETSSANLAGSGRGGGTSGS